MHGPVFFCSNSFFLFPELELGSWGRLLWHCRIPVLECHHPRGRKRPGIRREGLSWDLERPAPPKYPQRALFGRKSPEKYNPTTTTLLNFEPGPKRNKTETGFNLRGTTGFYKIKVAAEGKHTLNPPKHKQNKKQKKQTKQQYQKKTLFQLSVSFLFFGWVSKISLFWQPGPKRAHPQNTIKNRGFREQMFEKQLCVTKRPFLDPKNPKSRNSSYHFLSFFSRSITKNTNMVWNP